MTVSVVGSVPPLIGLVDASFHLSWSLWIQAPIALGVLVLAALGLRRLLPEIALGAWTWVLVAVAVLAVSVFLPQSAYDHFSGHEGAYSELLSGELPDAMDLTGHRTFAVPAGIAWVTGQLLPERAAVRLWLGGNRLSLALVLLALACSCVLLLQRDRESSGKPVSPRSLRLAAAAVVAGACLSPALLGWSATGFAIVPALALAMLSLVFGLARRPVLALALGALALGSRMETSPLVLAALLSPGLPAWRATVAKRLPLGLCGALGLLALQAFTLSQKRSELPLEDLRPDPSVFLENLCDIPLGGPWLSPAVLGLVLLLVGTRLRSGGDFILRLSLGLGLFAALLQPLFLVDVGARHFLPATLLVLLWSVPALLDGAAGALPSAGLGRLLAGLVLLLVLLPGVRGLSELSHRYMSGFDATLPAWEASADAGRRGPPAELLEDRCYLVLPGGSESWRGSHDSRDVREVHRAALARGAGWCIQWAVETDAEFSGDTRAERLDRAIHTLKLVPSGWLDPPPVGGHPWMLFEARPVQGQGD